MFSTADDMLSNADFVRYGIRVLMVPLDSAEEQRPQLVRLNSKLLNRAMASSNWSFGHACFLRGSVGSN